MYLSDLKQFEDSPKVCEIQIKTLFMHAWSQQEHLLRYKSKLGKENLPAEIQRKLAWIAASSWGSDSVLLELRKWIESQ
jgi:ppGpp synthetase/RelA/SpoT-type nucleotidyltranferase